MISPQLYSDWKAWAFALVQELTKPPVPKPTLLYRSTVAMLPAPSPDGMLVYVLDDVGGPTVAFSYNGAWLRVRDNVEVSEV